MNVADLKRWLRDIPDDFAVEVVIEEAVLSLEKGGAPTTIYRERQMANGLYADADRGAVIVESRGEHG